VGLRRLSALDAAFLTLESPEAPMHVGWAALFAPPSDGPLLSNLTISNIPAPPVPLYLMGCQAVRAYPVVPLTAGHGVSIGMTAVAGQACFGVYAQAGLAQDADRLARGIDVAIDELLAHCEMAPAT